MKMLVDDVDDDGSQLLLGLFVTNLLPGDLATDGLATAFRVTVIGLSR